MIHAVIRTKYQKYPPTTILKHANVLAKLNRFPNGHLHYMTPHDAYRIIIHVRTKNLVDISHGK